MARTEWLSEGAEKLAFELLGTQQAPHCDVAVVGSGYGGAVAAARLAGATDKHGRALKVWVLERGREHVPGSFPERFPDLAGHVRLDLEGQPEVTGLPEGLFDVRVGKDVSALMGNGLGGGSLINAAVLARPDESVFHTEPWPWQLADNALDASFARAQRMLGGRDFDGPAPPKLRALRALAEEMGSSTAVRRATLAVTSTPSQSEAGVPQGKCVNCGDCFTGCNHWAKNTLAMNYLPLAWRRGARLFTGVTVLSVGRARAGWELRLEFTDPKIEARFGAMPALRAARVILAAGAYGSTEILLRSHGRGLPLSDQMLGTRFSANGDMIAVGRGMPAPVHASAHEGVSPGNRNMGPTITGLIDLRSGSPRLVVEELAIPAALRRAFEEVVTSFGMLHDLARIDWSWHRRGADGPDPAAISAEAIERTAVYATMGDDGARGALRLANDRVSVAWEDVAGAPVFKQAIELLEQAHARCGGTVIPNPMWRLLPGRIGEVLDGGEIGGSVFTVHPLGGCAMAERAEEGVVNRYGQVFDSRSGEGVHQTLAVLDGAIVPTALGVNPCLTIAALAEYAVQGLAAAWALRLPDSGPTSASLRPLPARPAAPAPENPVPRPTAIRIAERLKSRDKVKVRVDAGDGPRLDAYFDAHLDLEYRTIEDLEAFLGSLPKILPIARTRLELAGDLPAGASLGGGARWRETVELEGQLRLFERESSTVACRIARAGWAWWRNRGKRELWQLLRRKRADKGAARHGFWEMILGWLAIASRAGEARLMVYDFRVLHSSGLFAPGDRLFGQKRIAYIAGPGAEADGRWPSPWDQLTKLPLSIERAAGGPVEALGVFEVDLPYFVQQHATQLQLVQQENQPRAIADLLSLVTYVARLIGGIHFWSLRAPDYPDPYPLYEFKEPFNAEAREEALEAAREAKVRVRDRLAHRLPGPVRGLRRTVVRLSPWQPGALYPEAKAGDPPQQRLPPEIRLTRYESRAVPRDPGKPPVLLIHGLGAGGNTFTLPWVRSNLVQHLASEGFDPWVLDLRTSIGLSCSKRDWTFDEVAFGDIPAAIDVVRRWTGAPKVDVVAHCIGAAMFCMAALAGKLKDSPADAEPEAMVRAAVLSQVGPLLELPATNRFRGYVASYLKHYLRIGEFDTTGSLTPFNRFLDRLLAVYPYPPSEWSAHHPTDACATVTHEAFCIRSYGIYGKLFEHKNLTEATLNRLGDYLGHIRYRTYQQTIFYATMRRLTDDWGRNVFVTHDNIRKNFRLPVCFIHGERNGVFDKNTSRRSFDLLASVFWPSDLARVWKSKPEKADGYSEYGDGKRLRINEIEGYGHQDCMIGADAHRCVYPKISSFLGKAKPIVKLAEPAFVVRPPRLGPIVGWTRDAGANGQIDARILFSPNDSRSKPAYAMTIVLRDGRPVPGHAKFHPLAEPIRPGRPTEAVDVRLPGADADLRIVVLTVHEEHYERDPSHEVAEPPADDPFGEALDRFPLLPPGVVFPSDPEAAQQIDDERMMDYVGPVLDTCKDLDLRREPLAADPRVCERRYAAPVSVAVLPRPILEAAQGHARKGTTFALASCRYAATAADRELADAAFGRLRRLLEAPAGAGNAPELLFLAGDAIYADATYGIFDPTLGSERYDQRYFEAWSAPNAREVLRRVPVYPMLDDHEVQENFEGAADDPEESVVAGLRAFESFQLRLTSAFPDPAGRQPKKGGYWYTAKAGGLEFFVADTRTERRRQKERSSLDATIMHSDRLKALTDWLDAMQRKDPAMPKFVVSPSVVIPWSRETKGEAAYSLRSDAWDGYPGSLRALLGFIAGNRIRNVVFLSGDFHCSLLCRIGLARYGAAPVQAYSIVSSGLYSPYPFANTRFEDLEEGFDGAYRNWSRRVARDPRPGELVVSYRTEPIETRASFAVVSASPANGAWRLAVDFDTGGAPCRRSLTLQ